MHYNKYKTLKDVRDYHYDRQKVEHLNGEEYKAKMHENILKVLDSVLNSEQNKPANISSFHNWCPTCRKRPDNGMFCTNSFHLVTEYKKSKDTEIEAKPYAGRMITFEGVEYTLT